MTPRWYRQAMLKEDFNLQDLSPTSLNNFIHQMLKDPILFDKVFINFFFKNFNLNSIKPFLIVLAYPNQKQ